MPHSPFLYPDLMKFMVQSRKAERTIDRSHWRGGASCYIQASNGRWLCGWLIQKIIILHREDHLSYHPYTGRDSPIDKYGVVGCPEHLHMLGKHLQYGALVPRICWRTMCNLQWVTAAYHLGIFTRLHDGDRYPSRFEATPLLILLIWF
jgi:hypothetical protein